MPTRWAVVIAAGVAVSLSGCGTVCNLAGGFTRPDAEPRVYGGVTRDLEIIRDLGILPGDQAGPTANLEGSDGDARALAVIAGCVIAVAAIDPILSFVGDTLTLPITIPLQSRRTAAEERNRGQPAAPGGSAVPDEPPPRVEQLPTVP